MPLDKSAPAKPENQTTQLAFYLNLYRTIIGPTGTLSGQLLSDKDFSGYEVGTTV